MAHERHKRAFPGINISSATIAERTVVQFAPTGTTERAVQAAGSTNVLPLGVALTNAAPGKAVTVHDGDNTVKVRAAASIGVGANVGVVSGTTSVGPVVGASGVKVYTVGQSETPAAAGEVFSLYVNPQQLSGAV